MKTEPHKNKNKSQIRKK